MAVSLPLPAVLAAIDRAAAIGARRVSFVGGEPTIHPTFRAAAAHALSHRFDEVIIFTNGMSFADDAFLDEMLALGTFTWRVSIQGGDAETHDRITRYPGAFARIIRGLQRLAERGQRITANVCVAEQSYRTLPQYPALLRAYGVRSFHVDMIRPASAGIRSDEELRAMLPRFAAMAPSIAALLSQIDDAEPIEVSIGNYPYCLLPQWVHRIHHGGEPTEIVATDDDRQASRIADKYAAQAEKMAYALGCGRCALLTVCRGVAAKYAELFGVDELRPIALEELVRTDTRGVFFLTRAARAHAHAVLGEPPPGWSKAAPECDERARVLAIAMTHEDGGDASITIAEERGAAGGTSFRVDSRSARAHEILRWVGFDERLVDMARLLAQRAAWTCERTAGDLTRQRIAVMVRLAGAAVTVLARCKRSRIEVSFEPEAVAREAVAAIVRELAVQAGMRASGSSAAAGAPS